jgi:hypothetical protein
LSEVVKSFRFPDAVVGGSVQIQGLESGWLYLSVLDMGSRRVLGFALSETGALRV